MFCFVPCYVMIIYGLLYPNKKWMPDFALLHAGAAIQAQVVHIGGSINQRTMFIYRVPEDNFAQFIFWPVNIILLVVPQLLAIRCMYNPQFFGHDDGNEVNVKSKKCVDGVVEITASDSFSKSARTTPPRCCTPVGAGPTSLLSVDDNVGMPRLEDERKSQATTPMLKVKFGGSNSNSGEEIAMSLLELKTYHDDLRRLSASATGRNTRRHLSDGGLLPGNIHVRRASGSGRKLTDDDMIQLESLSPKLIAESLKQCGDSGPPSPSGSFESSHEQWMLGNRRQSRGSNCSNQGNGPRGDLNMESLMEEKLPDFDDGITPASSMSIN